MCVHVPYKCLPLLPSSPLPLSSPPPLIPSSLPLIPSSPPLIPSSPPLPSSPLSLPSSPPPLTLGQETAAGKAVYLVRGEVCGGDTKVFPRVEGMPAYCDSFIMPTGPSTQYCSPFLFLSPPPPSSYLFSFPLSLPPSLLSSPSLPSPPLPSLLPPSGFDTLGTIIANINVSRGSLLSSEAPRVYHLVKPELGEAEDGGPRQGAKIMSEVFLTRLLSTKVR